MKYLSLISLLFFVNSYAQTDSTLSNPVKSIEDLCLNVVIQTDKFTGEVSYNSPDIENVSFIKYKTKYKSKAILKVNFTKYKSKAGMK